MHQILACFCFGVLFERGWTSEQSSEQWQHSKSHPIPSIPSSAKWLPTSGGGWWDDRYEPEETEASCCPIKKLGNRISRMVGYNLTSAKQHDCKDGCIYHDSEGRETCFTQVSINIINLYSKSKPKFIKHAPPRANRTRSATRR